MAISRTRQVVLNAMASILTQIVLLFLNFISRNIFIRTLGIDYLGVNGLFSNILTVLSFAELGIGHAIIFSLYKPLANHDEERLCSLMQLYKKFYIAIFFIVLIVGIALIPFLDFFIKGEPNIDDNLIVIYLFFLMDTAISYIYIYKQSIITADQKQYVVTSVITIVTVLKVISQISILYITHSYILFLVVNLLFNLAGNYYCSWVADKKYPFIQNTPKPLPKKEKKAILVNIKSMAAYKFGSIILNSSDGIIISAMVNITSVGLVSNYTMICMACNKILKGITNAFTASLGNLNALASPEKKYDVFNKVYLITAWVYGLASIGIIVLSKYFIEMWIGINYALSQLVVIAIVSEFYVSGIHTLESHYRYTMGYFVKGRLAPLLASLLNIFLAIFLCSKWGIAGVFFATSLSRILTLGIIDSWIIYRDGFFRNPAIYFVKNVCFLLLFVFIGMLCFYITSFFIWHTWFSFVLQSVIVIILYNLIMIVVFGRTREFKEILSAAKLLIK